MINFSPKDLTHNDQTFPETSQVLIQTIGFLTGGVSLVVTDGTLGGREVDGSEVADEGECRERPKE